MTAPETPRTPIARLLPIVIGVVAWLAASGLISVAKAGDGQLALTVVDKATGKPIACRMHLKNATGRPRLPKKVPSWDEIGRAHV